MPAGGELVPTVPGGLRTHVMVTLGAAMFCSTTRRLVGADDVGSVVRILRGVATGVGFVGAASVFKREQTISGISNAASIWISAAVGSEAILGSMRVAVTVAAAVAGLDAGLRWVERAYRRRSRARPAAGARPRGAEADEHHPPPVP